MKFIGFTVRKPRAYNYKPLYYDEKKEKLENLRKRYEGGKTEGGLSPDFKDRLKSAWHIKQKRTGNISKTTLLIYFVLAALLIYYIFLR